MGAVTPTVHYLQAIDQACRQALQTGTVVMPWSARSKMTYVDYRDVADAVAIAFTDSRLSGGTFELAAGGMIDRIELAELMSHAAGRELVAANPPARPQRVADGLAAMLQPARLPWRKPPRLADDPRA